MWLSCVYCRRHISHVICHMALQKTIPRTVGSGAGVQIEAKKAVDRLWYKQGGATKDAICWKSSDRGPTKAVRSRHLQIRSPIDLFIDRADQRKWNQPQKCCWCVLLHRRALFRNSIEKSPVFWISAPLTIKCRSLPYNIAIVDARPGVNDCYLLTVLSVLYLINSPSISLSVSSNQFLSDSLDFLKPLQAYLLLYLEPEVLKIFIRRV